MKKIKNKPVIAGLMKTILIMIFLLNHSIQLFSQITIVKTEASCGGIADGAATVNIPGGIPPFKFDWSNGFVETTDNLYSTISNVLPGIYRVQIRDQNGYGCCQGDTTFVIETGGDLTLTISPSNPDIKFCKNLGVSEITYIASASGGISPYTYSWLGGTLIVTEYGSYTCVVTDANLCVKGKTINVVFMPAECAIDPNELSGSPGFGEEQWVSVNEKLSYTAYFENDPDFATAAAQKVSINIPVPEKANMYSLRIGDFGFGDFVFTVPPNSSYYINRLDLVDSLGIYLDVIAGLDVNTHEAFWVFQSIDPASGLPPNDPESGFLPVNDTMTHNGEGFVNFTLQPKSTDMTGDSIPVTAEIIFDINEPVVTNTWINMVDALPPSSAVNQLPALIPTTSFDIGFTGEDDPGGCGISKFKFYYSKDLSPYNLYGEYEPGQQAHFTGMLNSSYEFFTLATDHVGNTEAWKDDPDVITLLADTNIQASNIVFSDILPDQFTFNWTNGNGLLKVAFIKLDTVGFPVPVQNTTYTASTAFGSGSQIGSTGWFCVFNSTIHFEGVTVTNLTPNKKYRVMVCEYFGSPGAEWYNTSLATGNPKNQKTCSIVVPTITGAEELCSGRNVTYETETGMSEYTWEVSEGGVITGGAGTNSVEVTWNDPGNMSLSVNYTNGEGCSAVTPPILDITVLPSPVPVVSGPSTACLREGFELDYYYSTGSGCTGYYWDISAGGIITAGTGTHAVEVHWNTPGPQYISVNYSNSFGCDALNPVQYVVIVDSVTVPGAVLGGTTISLGLSTDTLVIEGHHGSVITWQKRFNTNPYTNIPSTSGLIRYTDIPEAEGTWNYRALIQNDSCFAEYSEATAVIVIDGPVPRSWIGVVDEKWHRAGNWSPAGVPGPDDEVLIPSIVPNMPEVKVAGLSCHKITIEPGASVTIKNGVTLNVNGVELGK